MTGLAKANGAEFDKMWLAMMVQHHQGAIAMANYVLESTADDQVKQLAQSIVDGQKSEITVMRGLLELIGTRRPRWFLFSDHGKEDPAGFYSATTAKKT